MTFGVLVIGHGTDVVGNDTSGDRVLDVGYRALYPGIDVCAVLEDPVAGSVEGAVLQNDVIGITEQLLTTEMTADEAHVLRVPCQILTVEFRVVDGDVVALPERILGGNLGVVDLNILTVLEDILRVGNESVDIYSSRT